MRLRLLVQRHRLPSTQVLWTIGSHQLLHSPTGPNVTISQLLEQVNEVIPLESEDWGLEDYSVEVRNFECLHFAEVSDVLKEDDEVSIRPLQTSDLRFRKLSGRHQISSDGKHLVDGVAFGRPFLHRGSRPPIRIPPRKRIRLIDNEDDDGLTILNDNREVTVRSDTNSHKDQSVDGDNADDEDFEYQVEDEEAEDLAAEAGALLQDLQGIDRDSMHIDASTREANTSSKVERRSKRLLASKHVPRGLGLQGSDLPQLWNDIATAYPGVYTNPSLEQYGEDNNPSDRKAIRPEKRERGKEKLKARKKPKLATPGIQAKSLGRRRRESSASGKSVRFEEAGVQTPATVLEAGGNESGDGEFEPIDTESDKENAKPVYASNDSDESTSIGSHSSSSILSESDASSSDVSSSESSSASSTSASDSSSSSNSSSSEAESVEKKQKLITRISGTTVAENTSTSSVQTLRSIMKGPDIVAQSVTPGNGKKATKLRNGRRRSKKKLAYLKSIGVLAKDADLKALHVYQEGRKSDKPSSLVEGISESVDKLEKTNVDLEAKRQRLLKSIASGGIGIQVVTTVVDQEAQPSEQIVKSLSTSSKPLSPNTTRGTMERGQCLESKSFSEPLRPLTSDSSLVTNQFSESSVLEAPTQEPISAPSRRRAKLDIASSKRLLFGSLGLKTPKTKQDEANTRTKLMETIRPAKQTFNESSLAVTNKFTGDFNINDDSWKDKITMKAVECCYEGIELSTPPFPFVQRWDPQQQRGYRGGSGEQYTRNKKRKRNQHMSYLDETARDDCGVVAEEQSEQTPSISAPSGERVQAVESGNAHASESYQEAIDDQIMRDATKTSISALGDAVKTSEDLPALPEDMSICPGLKRGMAVPGAVVAFKQLDMSEKTNWQPQISSYRTATVDHLQEDGTLHMTLALRDQRRDEHRYDRATGERIYSKFEMPESDDEDEHRGLLEISFDDLIDPRLLSPLGVEEPQKHDIESPMNSSKGVTKNDIVPVSTTNEEPQENFEDPSMNVLHDEDIAPIDTTSEEPIPTGTLGKPTQDIQGTGHEDVQSEVDEDSRREISMLIKEAGWGATDPDSPVNLPAESDAIQSCTSSSPRFNGFSPSIPDDMSSKIIINDAKIEDEYPRSRPSSVIGDEPVDGQSRHDLLSASQPSYPVSNLGEEDVMDNSSPRRRSSIADIGISDYLDPQEPRNPSQSPCGRYLSINSPVSSKHNDTTELQDIDNTRIGSEELCGESSSHHVISEDSPKAFISFDGADSDSDFPTLETVISTTKTSFDTVVSEDDDDVLCLPSRPSKQTAKSKVSKRPPSPNSPSDRSLFPSTMPTNLPSTRLETRTVSSLSQPNPTLEFDNDVISDNDDEVGDLPTLPTNMAKRAQKPINGPGKAKAQIVDLTMSSDPAVPSGSDYEDSMPSGTGWIRKTAVAKRGGGRRGRNSPLTRSSGNSGTSPYQIMEDMLEALERRIH